MKSRVLFVLALSTLMSFGASAATLAVNRVGEIPMKTVSFRDLDLSTAQGAEALYVRLTGAAREVCRGAEFASFDACRALAVDDAVKTVGNPLLSSIHRSSSEPVEGLVRR